jgi:DNA polymerase-3 subunit epsilon
VAHCPCAGTVDAREYRAAVELARAAMTGEHGIVIDRLRERMITQAAQHRFEDASLTRDRLGAWLAALRRRHLVDALVRAERVEIRQGESTWLIEHARLIDASRAGEVGRDLPVPPPAPLLIGQVVPVTQVDESLCLARFCEARADRLDVTCTGRWDFPLPPAPTLSRLDEPRPDPVDPQGLAVATGR